MGMRYQPYQKYKESNIPWLNDVPGHWDLLKFKRLFRIRKRIAGTLGFSVLSITQRGIKVKNITSGDGQLSMDYSKYQLVNPGDFAMNHMDLLTGFVDVASQLGVTSPDYRVFTLEHSQSDSRYFLYILQLCYWERIFYPLGRGAAQLGRWRLPSEAFNEFVSPIPSLTEQTQIAAFLDHETTKIDTLIEKQKKLIELLKEKRQAVISHAVTKGLNPDAPMKDSGVEWLGEVPEGWVVIPLKQVALKMQTGPFGSQLHAEDYVEGGVPLVNPAHIVEGEIIPESKASVDLKTQERLSRHMLAKGDLILARRGELGRCAVVKASQQGWLCGTGSLKAALSNKIVPHYAFMLISSEGIRTELSLESKGSTMDNLNTETLGKVKLPLPSVSEQREILRYVKGIAGEFDKLESLAQQQVLFLQERRTALISAAVTGKIDVRGWVVPE